MYISFIFLVCISLRVFNSPMFCQSPATHFEKHLICLKCATFIMIDRLIKVYPFYSIFLFVSRHHSHITASRRYYCMWHFPFLILSYVGNVEINVEVKRYFCKAGVKGIQVVCLIKLKSIIWSSYWATIFHVKDFIQRRCPYKAHDFTEIHRKSAISFVFKFFSVSPSSASWDDEGDPGASDWRCAHSGRRLHVFHPQACMSLYTHLYVCLSCCDLQSRFQSLSHIAV